MMSEPVGHSGGPHLPDVVLVELRGVEGALLDRASAEAIALGLLAAQRAVLEVAVADRAIDDLVGSDRRCRVGGASQRGEQREAGDDQGG
jgi:hypothetical protein